MTLSIAKLVDLKRKKWQSKLQHTKSSMRQVLNKYLAKYNRVLSFSKTTPTVELPDDIVEEILHRLRVKDLVRWKTVSKGWKSLIESSQYLAEKHVRLNKKKYGDEELKISIESCSRSDFLIKYFTKGERLMSNYYQESEDLLPLVPGSCNGLVCVYDLFKNVYVFNPITRVIRTLSHPLGTTTKHTLGFKASSVGFGRDIVTERYKAVVLFCSLDNDKIFLNVNVFDLSSNEWRSVPVFISRIIMTRSSRKSKTNPVFINGSLFWLFCSKILVMDLHTEKFRSISLPKSDGSSVVFILWSLEDRLCAAEYRPRLGVVNVWVRVQDEVGNERWDNKSSEYVPMESFVPPLSLNHAWFSPTLVSPYQ